MLWCGVVWCGMVWYSRVWSHSVVWLFHPPPWRYPTCQADLGPDWVGPLHLTGLEQGFTMVQPLTLPVPTKRAISINQPLILARGVDVPARV